MKRSNLGVIASFIFVFACSEQEGAGEVAIVDDTRLRAAGTDEANWLLYGRTYEEHRFSPLQQITEQTIDELGLAWSLELDTTRGLEATPLVYDGVIYTTGSWSVVYAIDAGTGEIIWTFDPEVPRARRELHLL